MFAFHQIVLPLLILGKLEDARIPYAFTSVFHFCILVGMTSGIISELSLVHIYFYLWFHVDLRHLHELNHSTNWFILVFICRYICDIFGHSKSVKMTVFFPTILLQRRSIFVFPCYLARITDEVETPWYVSSHG